MLFTVKFLIQSTNLVGINTFFCLCFLCVCLLAVSNIWLGPAYIVFKMTLTSRKYLNFVFYKILYVSAVIFGPADLRHIKEEITNPVTKIHFLARIANSVKIKSCARNYLNINIPYDRHYKLLFVYFSPHFYCSLYCRAVDIS